MLLNKKQISTALYMLSNITERLIDVVDNNNKLQMSETHAMRQQMLKCLCDIEMDDFLENKRKNHRLRLTRGTTDKNNAYVGKPGELTIDTDAKTLRVHDGENAGGTTLARMSDIPDIASADYVVAWQNPTADNNYTWYRKYKSGWIEMGGYVLKNAGTTSVIVNFPIPFSVTPTVHITKVIDSAATEQNSIVVRTVSLDKFSINKLTTNNYVYWNAFGVCA